MNQPKLAAVRSAMQQSGYRVFDGVDPGGARRDLDLNLFGIRSDTLAPNQFDDWVGVFWFDPALDDWTGHVWPATTDPGLYWLRNPENASGTAVLVPGQYRGSHRIGLHRSQYVALVQNAALKVYRDNDRDDVIELAADSIQAGHFGINIHRANQFRRSTQVDKWSAGCQVLADPADFALLMDICNAAAESWGPIFSYTLLTESEVAVASPPAAARAVVAAGEEDESDDGVDALLRPIVKGRAITPATVRGLRGYTALTIAEAVLDTIGTRRLSQPAPGIVNGGQAALTAERLDRDIGPPTAKQTGLLHWQAVTEDSLKACGTVLSFVRLCYRQLGYGVDA